MTEKKGFWKKNKGSIIAFLIVIVVIIVLALVIPKNSDVPVTPQTITWEGPGGTYEIQVKQIANISQYITQVNLSGKVYAFPLRNSPSDVENIPFTINIDNILNKEKVFITRDPQLGNQTQSDSTIAALGFGEILGSSNQGLYKMVVKSAVNIEDNSSVIVATCDDANTINSIIQMELGDENAVYNRGKCIIIEGVDGPGIIKSADRLAYTLLGVF